MRASVKGQRRDSNSSSSILKFAIFWTSSITPLSLPPQVAMINHWDVLLGYNQLRWKESKDIFARICALSVQTGIVIGLSARFYYLWEIHDLPLLKGNN